MSSVFVIGLQVQVQEEDTRVYPRYVAEHYLLVLDNPTITYLCNSITLSDGNIVRLCSDVKQILSPIQEGGQTDDSCILPFIGSFSY